MAQPLSYPVHPQEKPHPASHWQQYQVVDRSSQPLPSPLWPAYYEQPDSWPADPLQHQYRAYNSTVEPPSSYEYTPPCLPSSCHAVAAFPSASYARDPYQSSPHSSASPFDDVERNRGEVSQGGSSRPLPLLTSSFSPRSAPCPRPELERRPPSPSPTPSVKEEPDDADGRFIMEISAPQAQTSLLSQSMAPPTEVPLRATQASSEMRSMMTVFRLNPFAMHNGAGRGTVPVQHETARALEAEPLIFEFQLDIDNMDISVNVDPGDPSLGLGLKDIMDGEPLRSFSPDFELHEAQTLSDADHGGSEWPEYLSEASNNSPMPAPQTWEIGFPRSEDRFSAPSSSLDMPHHHASQRRQVHLHHSISHPYFKASSGDSSHASSSSSGVHTHNHNHNHHTHTAHHHNHIYNYDHTQAQHPRIAPNEARVPQHHPRWTSFSSSSSPSPSSLGLGYHDTASRSSSTTYASSGSPGCDPEALPPMSVVPVRRWSLPDAHPHHANIHAPAPMPFLV